MTDSTGPATATATATTTATPSEPVPTQLGAAIGAGVASAVLGGLLWAAVVVATNYKTGIMAIVVGIIAGWVVQRVGRSGAAPLGIVGAACALLGCVLGTLFTATWFIAQETGTGVGATLAQVLAPAHAVSIVTRSFSAMDVLFYGIAVYEGYKFATKPSPTTG
ncbi:MAG: hypothetical protein JSR73_14365 [Proteobacteria bacterium]|nr:hypothetical protein [Pseudomonadota bacterium]